MVKMSVKYQGQFHCELTHEPSGSKIETDAPKDNQGKGERFSPTDLLGAALGSCILTTIGLVAARDGQSVDGATATVEKEMVNDPRRVGTLRVNVTLPAHLDEAYRKKYELVAQKCPVHKSLHPEVQMPISFKYI